MALTHDLLRVPTSLNFYGRPNEKATKRIIQELMLHEEKDGVYRWAYDFSGFRNEDLTIEHYDNGVCITAHQIVHDDCVMREHWIQKNAWFPMDVDLNRVQVTRAANGEVVIEAHKLRKHLVITPTPKPVRKRTQAWPKVKATPSSVNSSLTPFTFKKIKEAELNNNEMEEPTQALFDLTATPSADFQPPVFSTPVIKIQELEANSAGVSITAIQSPVFCTPVKSPRKFSIGSKGKAWLENRSRSGKKRFIVIFHPDFNNCQ